jgi:predicted permease
VFDRASQQIHRESPLADFRRWRETLTTVEHISAMRTNEPRVIARDGATGPVHAAEMSASAFRVARVQPFLGRPLVEDDERVGAEPVAVIGHDLWQSGFSSDPEVLGQLVQIDDTPHVIVGVMPEGFRFPINQRLWTPLRPESVGDARPDGSVFVFARLVPGATLEGAHSEVTILGLLPVDAVAQTTARLEPRVVPYAAAFFPGVKANPWVSGVIFLLGALLLIPPCANIAILVYARIVTRREEFAVRTALGASRGRIVMQVFVEVLVLATGAGMIGFLVARQFSGRLSRIVMPMSRPDTVPFWMDFTPSLATVICVAGLSLIAAGIAGAVPAFHATGRWRRAGLSGPSSRGTGVRLGKTWTALLATQVALSLAILPSAAEMIWGIFRPTIAGPNLPVEEFLATSLAMEGDTSRFDTLRTAVVSQLTSEAGISGVTVSAAALFEEPAADIEVEGQEASDDQARFNTVDDTFFKVFGARFLAGRSFEAGDVGPGRTPAIVNRSFVTEVAGGGNALGLRVRYRNTEDPTQSAPSRGWHEIVGVVEDFPGTNDGPHIFHPMTTAVHPVNVTVRVSSGIGPTAERLRAVVARVD